MIAYFPIKLKFFFPRNYQGVRLSGTANERQSREFISAFRVFRSFLFPIHHGPGGVTIFFATDTRIRTLTDAEYFRILLHGFLAPRPAELKEATASRLKTHRNSPALRLARIISATQRASLFFSARSAEETVCVRLRQIPTWPPNSSFGNSAVTR